MAETETEWSFDPNHVFDVNDETYWAAVLAALDKEGPCPTTTTATTHSPMGPST